MDHEILFAFPPLCADGMILGAEFWGEGKKHAGRKA
jgi:hypothetical protein